MITAIAVTIEVADCTFSDQLKMTANAVKQVEYTDSATARQYMQRSVPGN